MPMFRVGRPAAERGSGLRRVMAAVAALGCVAGLVWLVAAEVTGTDPAADATLDAAASREGPPHGADPGDPQADPDGPRSGPRVPGAPRSPSGADRFVLPEHAVGRVRDATGAPADVEVVLVVEDPSDPSGVRLVGPVAPEIDANGRAFVRTTERVVRWSARSGDTWRRGDATVEAGAEAKPTTSWGPHGLVRVLDDGGRAVPDVEVTLHRSEGGVRLGIASGRTDADGLALVPIPGDGGLRGGPSPPADATVLRVELPVVPAITAPFSPAGPWPIVIRMPRLASIEIAVASEDGVQPFGRVVLTPLVDGSQETGFAPWASADVVGSRARFPHVGTGLRFNATLRPAANRVTTRVEFDGPRAPRAAAAARSADATLPFGALRAVFTGRLLRAEGDPPPQTHVQIVIPRRSDGSPWRDLTTEGTTTAADGTFRIRPDLDTRLLDRAEVAVEAGGRELVRRRCGKVAPGETVDLGDVRLGIGPDGLAVPLLVAGRVVDEEGAPVAGVSVMAWRRRAASFDAQRTGTSAGGEPATWNLVRDTTAVTDASGAFAIRRDPGADGEWEVRIAYDAQDRAAPRVPFVPGARDIVMRLSRTASVVVRVILPDELDDANGPWFALGGEAADRATNWAGDTRERGGQGVPGGMYAVGYWEFRGLAAGEGRIVAFPPGRPEQVVAALDVTVEAGKRVDAGTLDLRRVVPVLTVRVLDDGGKGAADGAVWWRTSDAGEWAGWNAVTCRPDGTARVPAMTPVDLLARRVGSSFAAASRATSNTTLRPPPARKPTSVDVLIADGVRLPAPPFRLAVRLGRADDDHPDARMPPLSDPRNAGRPEAGFAADARRVTFAVSEPGRYDAVLMLWIETAGAGHGMPLPLDSRATTTVGTDGTRQTIVVRFTPDALAAAMSALRDE